MSGLLPDTVRREQLEVALCAIVEPLVVLFNSVPPVTDRTPSAQAARMAILSALVARCRREGIGTELVENGTHSRNGGRTRGHVFRPVDLAQDFGEAELPARPATLSTLVLLNGASARELAELAGECIARLAAANGGEV